MATKTPTTETFDLDLLESIAGGVAVREFEQSSASKQAGLFVWAQALSGLDDRTFVSETSEAIDGSASMANFRNSEHLHFKASAAYFESQRRFALAHPDKDCDASTLYERAYNKSCREAGLGRLTDPPRPCTCTTDKD